MKRLNFWKKSSFIHLLGAGSNQFSIFVFKQSHYNHFFCFLSNHIITIWPFRQVHEGALVFTEWNSKICFTQLFWYYSFYSRHSFLIYVLLGNYQLVPVHSVSFRVLQIGQNHFSSHIFINFCLSPQSSVLITIIECNVQAVFHSFLRIQHHTLSWRYIFFFARLEFALCWVNKKIKSLMA